MELFVVVSRLAWELPLIFEIGLVREVVVEIVWSQLLKICDAKNVEAWRCLAWFFKLFGLKLQYVLLLEGGLDLKLDIEWLKFSF